MKISESATYPHPVLASWSSDISGASLTVSLTLRENETTRRVAIHCATSLDHPDLLDLLEDGSAEFGCFITCRETGFRRLQTFGVPSGTREFAPGALLGLVQLRPLIWARRSIPDYAPVGVHPEFGDVTAVRPGEILALDEEQSVTVLRPPVASIESIFEITASSEIEDGLFEVDPDGDRITIRMAQVTFDLVQNLREGDPGSRAAVMNGLYAPVVMDVLHRLSHGAAQYEQHRWFEPFRRRCEDVGVDHVHADLLADAQKVLGRPFASLGALVSWEGSDSDD